jgi:hypothetical protein
MQLPQIFSDHIGHLTPNHPQSLKLLYFISRDIKIKSLSHFIYELINLIKAVHDDVSCVFVVFVFYLDISDNGLDVLVFVDVVAEESLLLKA